MDKNIDPDNLPHIIMQSGFDLDEYYNEHPLNTNVKGWVAYCMHLEDKHSEVGLGIVLSVFQDKYRDEWKPNKHKCPKCKQEARLCFFEIPSPYTIAKTGMKRHFGKLSPDEAFMATSYTMDSFLIECINNHEANVKDFKE
tara:strand:- start:541 stop:963 length:423 start_codon:yes stop_codon:yes gene_type:complete